MFDIGHVGQDLVLNRWFKSSRKCESDVCFFSKLPCVSFLFGFEIREVPNHQPPSSSETMTTTPQAFPAWWVAKVMSTPGDQMPTEKPLAPASRLVFVEFQQKPDEESTNETSAWTNHQHPAGPWKNRITRWWPDRKLGTCSAWIGGRRVLGSWSWDTRLVWHSRVISMWLVTSG